MVNYVIWNDYLIFGQEIESILVLNKGSLEDRIVDLAPEDTYGSSLGIYVGYNDVLIVVKICNWLLVT